MVDCFNKIAWNFIKHFRNVTNDFIKLIDLSCKSDEFNSDHPTSNNNMQVSSCDI